jgi:hypothetical protein
MRKQKTLKNHANHHVQTKGKGVLEVDGDSLD